MYSGRCEVFLSWVSNACVASQNWRIFSSSFGKEKSLPSGTSSMAAAEERERRFWGNRE